MCCTNGRDCTVGPEEGHKGSGRRSMSAVGHSAAEMLGRSCGPIPRAGSVTSCPTLALFGLTRQGSQTRCQEGEVKLLLCLIFKYLALKSCEGMEVKSTQS